MDSLLVYGSYGYTGRLIVHEAVRRGATPVVSGRSGRAVATQAATLGLEGRVFTLEDTNLDEHVAPFDAVLNCAGPFTETAPDLVDACLETGTHYLDITGEFPVFERLRRRDEMAREHEVTLLPGVGFEVVPSDCLAAQLACTLPNADELVLGIKGSPTVSRGTARTLLSLASEGVVRRNGRLVSVPPAYRSRQIDFGDGLEPVVTAPWADVVTAAHSTGIETIDVYAAVPKVLEPGLSVGGIAGRVVDIPPVRGLLERGIDAFVTGPDERQRATDRAVIWGQAKATETGEVARGRLRTPNPYALTAKTAVDAAEGVLEGERKPGFQTPASAFGPEFAFEIEGVEYERLEMPETRDRTAGSSADVERP